MPLLDTDSGCKVGWEFWSTKEEAEAASGRAQKEAARKAALGYDFGYQWPGEIQELHDHARHGHCWRVTIP